MPSDPTAAETAFSGDNTWDRRMAWMAYTSLLVLVFGLFTSTSLCSLSLGLMFPPGLYFTWYAFWEHKWRALPASAWMLVVLAAIGILSCAVNHGTIDNPLKAAFKVKYFFLGALAIAPIRHLIHSFLTPSKIRILLISLVGTMTVTTLYGLFVIFSQNDFLNLHETLSPGRNCGFTSFMRHAHSSLYTTVVLSWGLVHTEGKLANIRTFLFIGIIVGIVGIISSGTRGAIGALLIGLPLIWGHRRWMWGLLIGGLASLAAVLAVNLQYSTDTGIFRPVDPDRPNMWFLAIKAFEEKPLLGHGVRQFEKQAPRLEETHGHWLTQPSGKIRGMAHAHNIFMQFLADMGTIGLLSYLMWLWLFIKYSWANTRIRWGVIAFMVATNSAGCLQYVFDTQGALTIAIVFAFAMALMPRSEAGEYGLNLSADSPKK